MIFYDNYNYNLLFSRKFFLTNKYSYFKYLCDMIL